ncbi:MAG: hypothetical protein E7612_07230 [Ruminococcaceae bacterium]|nr:hypothetical protein [Oscillospiraceae bacterium]
MTFNIKDFGAVGDGKTINTIAIQSAIDACYSNGGGTVLVEGGVYMFGSIVMKSNINLHIESNATLLGSPRCADYPERANVKHVKSELLPRGRNACYIYAEESENISITGMGIIDCNGSEFVRIRTPEKDWKYERIDKNTPPRVVFFTGCRNVRIEDISMINQPAGWSYWISDCDYVKIDGIKIIADVEFPNNDGIHVNSSRNVTISNCDITCGDDCIVIRANNVSLAENKICERVTVTNCNLTSYASGIRVGWMNDGVIKNCTFSNLVMTDTSVGIAIIMPYMKFNPDLLYTFDIGREATLIENLSFNNIIMDNNFGPPIKIEIADNPDTMINAVKNIYFSEIHAKSPAGIYIVGRSEDPITNVRFSSCTFELINYSVFGNRFFHGGQSQAKNHGTYPNITHCKGVLLNNVEFI